MKEDTQYLGHGESSINDGTASVEDKTSNFASCDSSTDCRRKPFYSSKDGQFPRSDVQVEQCEVRDLLSALNEEWNENISAGRIRYVKRVRVTLAVGRPLIVASTLVLLLSSGAAAYIVPYLRGERIIWGGIAWGLVVAALLILALLSFTSIAWVYPLAEVRFLRRAGRFIRHLDYLYRRRKWRDGTLKPPRLVAHLWPTVGRIAQLLFRAVNTHRFLWRVPPGACERALEIAYPLLDVDLRERGGVDQLELARELAFLLRHLMVVVAAGRCDLTRKVRVLHSDIPYPVRDQNRQERDRDYLYPTRNRTSWEMSKEAIPFVALAVSFVSIVISIMH
ncbi:hypothetical protein [Sciscionella marina]|uniref:hypothetical protein n=1 Tax=Sciscionella marina TaxID=508770 RepID=UPI0012F64C81|nr:hypothetical protein [Sciscionella marina]